MAIKKISVLNNDGTWTEAEPIGADCNNITLKNIVDAGLAVGENALSAKVINNETGTAAWNKHNKLCDAVGTLDIHFSSAVIALSNTFDAEIGNLSNMFNSQIVSLSSAFSSAMSNLNSVFSSATTSLNNTVTAALPQTHMITIASDSWNASAYTYTNSFFQSQGYVYWISPLGINLEGVYANDITVANEVTFGCLTTPENYVTINIIRMQDGTPS